MTCHLVVGAEITSSGDLELRVHLQLFCASRPDVIFENCGRLFKVSAGGGGGRDVPRMVAQASTGMGSGELQRALKASF